MLQVPLQGLISARKVLTGHTKPQCRAIKSHLADRTELKLSSHVSVNANGFRCLVWLCSGHGHRDIRVNDHIRLNYTNSRDTTRVGSKGAQAPGQRLEL